MKVGTNDLDTYLWQTEVESNRILSVYSTYSLEILVDPTEYDSGNNTAVADNLIYLLQVIDFDKLESHGRDEAIKMVAVNYDVAVATLEVAGTGVVTLTSDMSLTYLDSDLSVVTSSFIETGDTFLLSFRI